MGNTDRCRDCGGYEICCNCDGVPALPKKKHLVSDCGDVRTGDIRSEVADIMDVKETHFDPTQLEEFYAEQFVKLKAHYIADLDRTTKEMNVQRNRADRVHAAIERRMFTFQHTMEYQRNCLMQQELAIKALVDELAKVYEDKRAADIMCTYTPRPPEYQPEYRFTVAATNFLRRHNNEIAENFYGQDSDFINDEEVEDGV